MANFFNAVDIVSPIGPREAFFGGRTNAIRLYHKCKPGEKIKYVDVCSLYPWVCKTGMFPVGYANLFRLYVLVFIIIFFVFADTRKLSPRTSVQPRPILELSGPTYSQAK